MKGEAKQAGIPNVRYVLNCGEGLRSNSTILPSTDVASEKLGEEESAVWGSGQCGRPCRVCYFAFGK